MAEAMEVITKPRITFLDLPRELRDMIYAYIPENTGVFTYDIQIRRRELLWKNDVVGTPKNGRYFEEQYANHGVGFGTGHHKHAILSTCQTIYHEALPILYANTPLGIWRPMYDYGGKDKYFDFTTRLFEALPSQAGRCIRVLQIQGELWQRGMAVLLAATVKYLPALKNVQIALDPYYDNDRRRTWFDEVEARQLWPSVAMLASRATQLEQIDIVFAPPQDVIYIWQEEAKGVWLSGARYRKFVWSYLQWLVLKVELTIFSGIVHYSAMTLKHALQMLESRENLAALANRKAEAKAYLMDLAKMRFDHEREWLRESTGRFLVEMSEQESMIIMDSPRDATTRWCKMTYSACPRGFADPEGLLSS